MRTLKTLSFMRLCAVLIVTFMPGRILAIQQGDVAEPILSYEETVIVPELDGSTDEWGRAPFFRLTFQSTAGIGPEDLSPPFFGFVELGTFAWRDAYGNEVELTSGNSVEIGVGEDFSLRNLQPFEEATLLVLALPGSCRMFSEHACTPPFLPYDFMCDAPCRPDVTNTLIFKHQSVVDRLWALPMSVYELRLPAGHIAETIDPGGETGLMRLQVRVETGTLVTNNGDVYVAGDEFTADADDILIAGDSGATLIVLRIGEPLE